MRAISYRIDVKKGEWIYIEPLGDLHIGNVAFEEQKLLERIEAIKKDPNRYWIGMGDYIDAISPWKKGDIDKRFEENVFLSSYPTLNKQIDRFIEIMKPIKDKCLGLLWGNHEWGKMEVSDFEKNFCEPLETVFLGARCFVILRVYDARSNRHLGDWKIFAVHGSYTGVRTGGAFNRIQDLAGIFDADIYLHAHTHAKGFQQDYRITIEQRGRKIFVREKPVIFGLTGGFINPFALNREVYFDKKAQPRRIRVGTITIAIDPWEGKLHGFD